MVSLQFREFDFETAECPMTWGSGVLDDVQCSDKLDKLWLAGTPWGGVMERLIIAWSLHENGDQRRARQLLVDCYTVLLPQRAFHGDCDLVRDFREALRIVLDATWAVTCTRILIQSVAELDNLVRFIEAIPPLRSLSAKQRAAVYAIRGRLAGPDGEQWFRKAISVSPEEGKWRYLLGWIIQDRRKCLGTPSLEEYGLLSDAYRLRNNPDTVVRLARTLTDMGSKVDQMRAETLMSEAMMKWPEHPRVLTQVASIMTMIKHIPPAETFVYSRALYLRVLSVFGERAFIHFKLGALCMMHGEAQQAGWHFERAQRLNPAVAAKMSMQMAALSALSR